jgi:hypothetical protein
VRVRKEMGRRSGARTHSVEKSSTESTSRAFHAATETPEKTQEKICNETGQIALLTTVPVDEWTPKIENTHAPERARLTTSNSRRPIRSMAHAEKMLPGVNNECLRTREVC